VDFVAEAAGERIDSWLEANILEPGNTSVSRDPKLFLSHDQYNIPWKYRLNKGAIEHHTAGVDGASESPSDSEDSGQSELSRTAEQNLATPVVQYINALDRNEFDAATAVIHSDAKTNFKSAYDEARGKDFIIQTVEVNNSADHPIVSLLAVFKNKESVEIGTFNWNIVLMEEHGIWKMYRIIKE
jgi:hypothetical protein